MHKIFFDTDLKFENEKEQYIGQIEPESDRIFLSYEKFRNFDTWVELLTRASNKMRCENCLDAHKKTPIHEINTFIKLAALQ